jgi:hypothetical protein
VLPVVPSNNVHNRVLAQTHVAGNEPIRKPIGMHAQQALGLLVRWALANLTPEFPNTPRENWLATCNRARLPPKSP